MPVAMTRRAKLDAFEIGDRVELLLFYSFDGEPPPLGTVVRKGIRCVHCKMDRSGKVVGLEPSDLRVITKRKSA